MRRIRSKTYKTHRTTWKNLEQFVRLALVLAKLAVLLVDVVSHYLRRA